MPSLLIANDGGHLTQLWKLAPRLQLPPDRIWVTPKTQQSESLLADEEVFWVDRAPTRDGRAAARNAWQVRKLLGRGGPHITHALSTGSSLAVSVLPQTALRGIPSAYIESATRVNGPSLSGRVLAHAPGVQVYTQCTSWASDRWCYGGSVFDGYQVVPRRAARPVRRMVVSLGTSEVYGFRALVERLLKIAPRDVDVLWQVGDTNVADLDIEAYRHIPSARFQTAIAAADVVVAHAGTGIALTALEAGKLPVLVPRRAGLGEHVDDHQAQIGRQLGATGLAVVRDIDALDWDDLEQASKHEVTVAQAPPFRWGHQLTGAPST
jgi:UDP-N-acetylglucosamine--N-acetylmuramyl-(pentapeptide) pyrophosphoryl-undecaprenol N-acetylglucosamine transferase